MAIVTKPMALDETLQATNAQLETTDATPVNIADVLQTGLANVASAISPNASDIPYDNTTSGLTADDVQEAIDELATEKADSSTTLAGYGIADAYTQTETDNLLASKMSYADNGVLGAKNLNSYFTLRGLKLVNVSGTWSDNVYTYNDVTFTVLTDSDDNVTGITVNGTASAKALFYTTAQYSDFLTDGFSYTINGNASGYSSNTAFLQIVKAGGTGQANVEDSYTFTYDNSTQSDFFVCIRIDSGKVATNLTFYPMIRLATDTDSTFQPYAMTNQKLTSEVRDTQILTTTINIPSFTDNVGALSISTDYIVLAVSTVNSWDRHIMVPFKSAYYNAGYWSVYLLKAGNATTNVGVNVMYRKV